MMDKDSELSIWALEVRAKFYRALADECDARAKAIREGRSDPCMGNWKDYFEKY